MHTVNGNNIFEGVKRNMKLLNYIEANDDIRMTYKNHMSLNNFTFSETTWFLIDSFERAKGTDKLIVYILFGKGGN